MARTPAYRRCPQAYALAAQRLLPQKHRLTPSGREDRHAQRTPARHRAPDPPPPFGGGFRRLRRNVRRRGNDALHRRRLRAFGGVAPVVHARGRLASPRLFAVLGARDRTSVVEGKSVSVRVDLGSCRIIKNNTSKQLSILVNSDEKT